MQKYFSMDRVLQVYRCLCDENRLRILNLLKQGPLCVCHLQEILGESQVRVSKQLAYLRRLGVVEVSKRANWRIYRLAENAPPLLEENLKCLQDLSPDEGGFAGDLARLGEIDTSAACLPEDETCCLSVDETQKP